MAAVIADERGRVPFAVVAILLLVSSATIAATMGPKPAPEAPPVDVVVDRVEAEGRTALRRAVRQAATDAASNPVITPANTPVGRALGPQHTFRNSLRLRIYAAAREHLAAIERRRDGVVATTSLPPIDASDAANVSRALDRVELKRTNVTAITVRVHNVTTTVRRGDRVLSQRTTVPRVTVATPVLALHDRVSAYERRLNADVTSPGLEQRLAAIMNAAGWARGYAQYSGVPIDNVISNGHVEVATNAALLGVQRSTIGRVDADAREQLHAEVGQLAATDLLAMRGGPSVLLEQAISSQSLTAANEIEGLDVPGRDEPMRIGINHTARDVFLMMVRGSGRKSGFVTYRQDYGLQSIIRRTYSADVRLAATRTDHTGGPPELSPPGPGWSRVSSNLEESVTVTPGGEAVVTESDGTWHALSTYSRRVVTQYERTATWINGGRRIQRRATSREAVTVSVTLLGRHAPGVPGPAGNISGVHRRGVGPLGGPNLAGVESAARRRLITENGGPDAVARRAAAGSLSGTPVTIRGSIPDGIDNWIYRDLRDLRREVANVSVSVDRRAVGTFEVNPPRLLREKLASRRDSLLDAAPHYDGVADRARVAARAKYLNVVSRALRMRALSRDERRGALGDALRDANAGTVENLQQSAYATVDSPGARKPALRGPGGPVRIRVDAAPAYLQRGPVSEEKVPAVDGRMTPLDTRNFNVFSLPYGDVLSGFLNAILGGPKRTNLATAAQVLKNGRAVDVAEDTQASGVTMAAHRQTVRRKIGTVRVVAAATLRSLDVGNGEGRRRTIVRAGLSEWNTTASKALAISNGSAAEAIAEAADARTDLTAVERDRLYLELDRSIRHALETSGARPKSKLVKDASAVVKKSADPVIRQAARKYEDAAIQRLSKGRVTTLPSGLPIAPVPGYWYATTNVWHVQVRGEYARFAVRATRGRPTTPGAGLRYARDGDVVSLDVDGDGTDETLGKSTRVRFSANVDVVVVVPPGPQGVGDVAGPMNEVSTGW